MGSAFVNVARQRLSQKGAQGFAIQYPLFEHMGPQVQPSQNFHSALSNARALYGAGLAFASLSTLAEIVKALGELLWEPDTDKEISKICTEVDLDITQAIQVREFLHIMGD